MRRIGVFGGRFDPIHIGHLIVAQDAVELLGLDKLYFLVSYTPPHKECYCSFDDRLEMVKLAISGNPLFEALDIEKKLGLEKCYTFEVMKVLMNRINSKNLFLIIGMDQFNILPTWYRWRDLVELVEIAVLRRPGDSPDQEIKRELENKVIFLNSRLIGISSTEIRKRVKEGKPIRYLVPETVERHIISRRLYSSTQS